MTACRKLTQVSQIAGTQVFRCSQGSSWEKKNKWKQTLKFYPHSTNSKQRLPRWISGKESAYQCKRHGFNHWVRKISWRRKWQLTLVFLPGKSHGQQFMGSQRVRHGGATEHACTIKWISTSRNKIFERIPYVFQGRHACLQILFVIIFISEWSRIITIQTKPIMQNVFLRPRENTDY